MDMTSTLALAAGAAWASGLNLYAAMLVFGLLGLPLVAVEYGDGQSFFRVQKPKKKSED